MLTFDLLFRGVRKKVLPPDFGSQSPASVSELQGRLGDFTSKVKQGCRNDLWRVLDAKGCSEAGNG